MTDQIPPNKTLAGPPAECKTTFTGEDPAAIHPEHDPHLQDRMVTAEPRISVAFVGSEPLSAAVVSPPAPKKTTERKE